MTDNRGSKESVNLQDIADDIEQSDGIALMLTGTSKQLGIRQTAIVIAALRKLAAPAGGESEEADAWMRTWPNEDKTFTRQNCGAECGVFNAYWRDLVSCGKRECEREASNQKRYEEEDAQERAAADHFDRYR